MERRLRQGRLAGEQGVLLDGFPRTVKQAEALLQFSDVQVAVNLSVDLRVRCACRLQHTCCECGRRVAVWQRRFQPAVCSLCCTSQGGRPRASAECLECHSELSYSKLVARQLTLTFRALRASTWPASLLQCSTRPNCKASSTTLLHPSQEPCK